MHIIADLVATSFPALLDLPEQMKFAESAAGGLAIEKIDQALEKNCLVNMETINADVREIESRFAKALAEQERKGDENTPQALRIFLDEVRPKIAMLRDGLKLAQEAFVECAEYYGELARNAQADVFFTRISTFVKHFEQALSENEARRAAEQVL